MTVEKNLAFEDAQKNPSEFVKTVETYFSSERPDFYKQFCYMTTEWDLFKRMLHEYLCLSTY